MGAVVTLVMAAVAAAVVIGLVGLLVGLVIAVVALAVKVLPLFLVGYVVVKLIQRSEHRRGSLRAASSEAWLDAR